MQKRVIETYGQAVEYLYAVPRFTQKNQMQDTRRFLEALGHPDRKVKIIHVAGTNGKGSVCTYLSSILNRAGYSCGVFTSPHLVECRERFTIDGQMVSEETFYWAFMEIYDRLDWESLEKGEGYHPTFFEYLFFMAMLIFEESGPDYCILETGLGGRLDATNAVERKELSVITRIGLDHVEYLGDTLEAIAGEKAGIIMEKVPVVYLRSDEAADDVIRLAATKKGAPAYIVSESDYGSLNFKNKTIDFSYYSRYYNTIRICLHTIARYQVENAALAVRAIETLDQGKRITAKHIAEGIERAFWAGRMEEVRRDFYVDGAHNGDGIRAFLETVAGDCWQGERHLLFSVVKDKDYHAMIRALAGSQLFDRVSLVQMQGARAAQTKEMMEIWEQCQCTDREVTMYPGVEQAVRELLSHRREEERIYAAGSLYLVGEIKDVLERCVHD